MDPLGDVLLAVHEDLGDDFFCMICTNMTYMCHILSHLALKNYFLAVLEKSLSWVMVVTLILESLILQTPASRQVVYLRVSPPLSPSAGQLGAGSHLLL